MLGILALAVAPGSLGAAPAEAPRSGGRIVWVDSRTHDNFDANVNVSRYTAWIQNQIYDPLVWQIEPDRFVPGLAESWQVSPDRATYTFKLRRDVVFHDGTPFNAQAVKFTLERILDPETKSRRVGELPNYGGTDVVDAYTVRIRFTKPYNQFLENLAGGGLPPASPAGVRARGKDFARFPVGTGPFFVKEWRDEKTMVLARNARYKWGPGFLKYAGPPYLEEIVLRFVTEPTTRLLALETGEAQYVSYPPEEEIERIRQDPNYRISVQVESGLVQNFPLNFASGPTRELPVRQALNYAISRKRVAQLVFFNTVNPARGPLSSRNWAFWRGVDNYFPHDPLRAARLLDEAGWKLNPATKIREKAGQPLRLRLVTATGFPDAKVAELAQAMWREAGMDVRVELMADAAVRKRYEEGTFEIGRLGLGFFDPDSVLYGSYHSSMIEGGGRWNRGRIVSRELDAMLEAGRVSTNVGERKQIYQRVQKWLLDNAAIVPVWEHTYVFASPAALRDVQYNLRGQPMFHAAWMAK
jgi:peptide/nickel transport system substrate-binding protein